MENHLFSPAMEKTATELENITQRVLLVYDCGCISNKAKKSNLRFDVYMSQHNT
jgi:hypothetical protein